MHNAIAHHLLTSLYKLPPVYILGMTSHGMEYPFGQFGVRCPGCVPSRILVPLQPSCWLGRRS